MPRCLQVLAAPLLALLLTACNTSDALTPKVDVGGGLHPSAPVTTADASRMAAAPDMSAGSGGYAAPTLSGPQNRQEAQAYALGEGAMAPIASQPLPAPDGASAVAPAAPDQQSALARSQPAQTLPAAAANATTATRSPGDPSQGSIRFLPIIGAPVEAVTPLSRQLGASARAAGLAIKSSSDTSSEHILKGYLSAFEDGDKVTVVYVWDVLDGSGARLHRIQGQETAPKGGSDPWAAVPTATMQMIGQKTILEYTRWRQARPG